MNIEEKNERMDIFEGEARVGCVTVRYPQFSEEYKKLNSFYENIASSYIRFAEKKIPVLRKKMKFPGIFSCAYFSRVTYSDNIFVCVQSEARIYAGNELYYRKRFSNVWEIPKCTLKYLRKFGVRKSYVGYNGKELYLFGE